MKIHSWNVCRRQTVHVFFFFLFSFLDLYLLFGKHVIWIKYFLFSFSSCSPSWPSIPRGHHLSIRKEIFQLELWGSVLSFYKEEDKIQKGRRENKAPINSSWANRQTGAAEQGSPLKKSHIFFWWHLIILFKTAVKNRHFISKKGERSNILLHRDEKAHLWIIAEIQLTLQQILLPTTSRKDRVWRIFAFTQTKTFMSLQS